MRLGVRRDDGHDRGFGEPAERRVHYPLIRAFWGLLISPMHGKGKIFVATVVAGAFALGVHLCLTASIPNFGSLDVVGVFSFAIVALIAEANAVDFKIGIGPRQPQASVAFLPFLGGILIFPPIMAVSLVAIVVTISQLLIRRTDWIRGPFNVAQSILSAGLSALVYNYVAGGSGYEVINILGFFFLVLTFFTTNVALNAIAISLLRDLPVVEVLRKVAGPKGSNLLYDFLVSPLAWFAAVFYATASIVGLILTVVPLLVVRSSYKAKLEAIEANEDLLTVLVKAIETRDPYTSGHSVRVQLLAQTIATDMQLASAKIQMIAKAALLHDIGKIDADYAAVIRKPHDLTPDERTLIQTHAVRGADLLANLSSVNREIVLGVRHHHERYDGQGYPDGLVGPEIPLAGRIIMICDSVDAMLSDRPYRKALPIEAVRQELERCAGTQFDPGIVAVMLAKDTLERAAQSATRDKAPARLQAVG